MQLPASYLRRKAFSLIEVVLALGIIAFAVLAIVGLLPVGLSTSRSAQNQSRATQIAADILNSLAAQSANTSASWTATIQQPWNGFTYDVHLDTAETQTWLSADNDGSLVYVDPSNVADEMSHPYQLKIVVTPSPPGFPADAAGTVRGTLVTLAITTPPSPKPDAPTRPDQTVREFSRIITRL